MQPSQGCCKGRRPAHLRMASKAWGNMARRTKLPGIVLGSWMGPLFSLHTQEMLVNPTQCQTLLDLACFNHTLEAPQACSTGRQLLRQDLWLAEQVARDFPGSVANPSTPGLSYPLTGPLRHSMQQLCAQTLQVPSPSGNQQAW